MKSIRVVVLLCGLIGGRPYCAVADDAIGVSPAREDGTGALVHTVESEYQSQKTKITVLLPGRLEADKRYPVLYVLPVEPLDEVRWGSSLLAVEKDDLADKYGLICVFPTFSALPWYADHPTDARIRQESYMLKVVVPFIDRTYPTLAGPEGRLLAGFSKSGWGAFSLLLRHPDVFGKAAAWDAPLMMEHTDKYGSGPIFGTQENFEKYQVSKLLKQQAASWSGPPRLIHFGYGNFRDQHESAHRLMDGLKIAHLYRDGPKREHCWSSGWLPEAVEMLVEKPAATPIEFSGRYPHLAMFNHQGECGTGAVVPWADRLWVITYGPHLPNGSDDKLYEIDASLNRVARPESVGGTPANRMIHRESGQLNIGPYFIDARRNVRVIPPSKMFGRLTATARHLADPANKLYIYDMEGLLYEVDVHSLAVNLLFKRPVPGWHGKGAYSGQGRLVLANNGEYPADSVNRFKPFDYFLSPQPTSREDAGVLAEWNGRDWRLIERRQFNDVTGPGGILGPADDKAPLWAVGWDRRSVILKLCDGGRWQTFRLPIADYSYTGRHGWHTEWPRIREVTGGKYLMNMHGGWFDFPATFAAGHTGGLRPLGDYLKITGDFCGFGGRIVFGCDDAALVGDAHSSGVGDTLNRLIGQSNSNLWFTTWAGLAQAGRPAGFGGPWLGDDVKADQPSAPYLVAGYKQRVLHLAHQSAEPVAFTIEIDKAGDGQWTVYRQLSVDPHGYAFHVFPDDLAGQWVRLRTGRDAEGVTAYFHYGPGGGAVTDRGLFAALADVDQAGAWNAAVIRSEGDDRVPLGVLTQSIDASGKVGPARTCQVGPDMQFRPTTSDSPSAQFLQEKILVKDRVISSDDASVIVTSGKLRVRLPKRTGYETPWATGWPRALRELVTERALLNADGSFYLLPRDISGGLRGLKPVCTHNKRITDFCSWRGMLVLAGCPASAKPDGHYVAAADGQTGLWFGDIDDLWKLGKPAGRGGPWLKTPVEANAPSDPYLMAGYDRKTVELSHDAAGDVSFTILVDVAADDTWFTYRTIRVPAGQTVGYAFPAGYSAHWVRLKTDRACSATAVFNYD